ncbi:hypothetical protein Q5424_05575 [Conexibacter sp. JD483]|uniref:hypothetical protein n=1 Tax=unclassified Conexibacter TaxID=2627773 RepID=UPI00271597DD|nr:MULTISPECIES: hypothetical protein [unclassified Conexibacter]MDO8185931.1 hypothetical protein [Conexibacter sp. CPCC 205706]MDO8199422.1 hypothetical protein [Conexibacter sp. CPCC 205762]MDR9368541.1 hypothetical protein [Conexibacter sp. JD483]
MGEETLVVVIFGTLHLVGLGLGMVLLLPLLREEHVAPWVPPQEDDDGGGGGNDRVAPDPPRGPSSGGLPLPDAVQTRVRLRSGERLADRRPARDRRPAHPATPSPAPRRVPQR